MQKLQGQPYGFIKTVSNVNKKKKKIQKGKIEKKNYFPRSKENCSVYDMTNLILGHMQLLNFVLQKGYGNTSLLKGIILTGLSERQTN